MTDYNDVCEFCNKQFSNKHNLHVHQRTAKYCLKLRSGDQNSLANELSNTTCEHCQKIFTSRQTLMYHVKICKKVLAFELKELHQKQIKALEHAHAEEVNALKARVKHLESRTIFHLV